MQEFLNNQKTNELFGEMQQYIPKSKLLSLNNNYYFITSYFPILQKQKLIKLKKDLAYAKSFYGRSDKT